MKSYATFSKMAEEAINCLNWKQIMEFYNSAESYETQERKNKDSIKKELRDLIRFVIESNVRFLEHEQWIIFWSNPIEDSRLDKFGCKLEVIFAPTKSVSFEKEIEEETPVDEEELSMEERERDTLNQLLEKYVIDENYEVAAVIHNRLKKLNKMINK